MPLRRERPPALVVAFGADHWAVWWMSVQRRSLLTLKVLAAGATRDEYVRLKERVRRVVRSFDVGNRYMLMRCRCGDCYDDIVGLLLGFCCR